MYLPPPLYAQIFFVTTVMQKEHKKHLASEIYRICLLSQKLVREYFLPRFEKHNVNL